MILFQIFFSLFVIFVLGKTIGRWRNKEIGAGWLIFWIIFWLLAESAVLSPRLADLAAYSVGIGRGADLIIYISLAVLFFLFFRLLVKQERMNRDITKLTRKISLMESDKK